MDLALGQGNSITYLIMLQSPLSDRQALIEGVFLPAIDALKLPGIRSLTETRRVYPEGSLVCHVLGFVGIDNQGLDGME